MTQPIHPIPVRKIIPINIMALLGFDDFTGIVAGSTIV